MEWRRRRAILVAIGWMLVTALGALPAAARTLHVLQQSSNIFIGSDGQGGSISGRASHWFNGAQRDGFLAAGGFKLRGRASGSSDPYVEFMAFCVEITTSIRSSYSGVISYERTPDLFDPLRRDLVAMLYQEVYDPTGSVTHQGAFQLALWKLTHGDVSRPEADGFNIRDTSHLRDGVLSFTQKPDGRAQSDTFDARTPGAFDLAQSWLDRLSGGRDGWSLSGRASDHVLFLANGTSQNLVVARQAAPWVGVPAGDPLAADALGVGGRGRGVVVAASPGGAEWRSGAR